MKVKIGDEMFLNLRRPRVDYLYRIKDLYIKRFQIMRSFKTSGYYVIDGGKEKFINVKDKRSSSSDYTLSRDHAIALVTKKIAVAMAKVAKWRGTMFTEGLHFIKYNDYDFTIVSYDNDKYERTTKGYRTDKRYFYFERDNRPLRVNEQGAFAMFVGQAGEAETFIKEITQSEMQRIAQAEHLLTISYLTDK